MKMKRIDIVPGHTIENEVLESIDFSHQDLRGVFFRHCIIIDCDFSHANLDGAIFRHPRESTGADLSLFTRGEGKIIDSVFKAAHMYRVDIDDADCCDFGNAFMQSCNLFRSTFLNCDFIGADLSMGELSHIQANNCSFTRAKMRKIGAYGGLFNHCSLVDADLRNAELSLADFPASVLCGARLQGAKLRDVISLPADIRYTGLVVLNNLCDMGLTIITPDHIGANIPDAACDCGSEPDRVARGIWCSHEAFFECVGAKDDFKTPYMEIVTWIAETQKKAGWPQPQAAASPL